MHSIRMWWIVAVLAVMVGATENLSNAKIDELSKRSLYVKIFKNEILVGRATGFLVKWKDKPYLITNWHVVTGHHPLDPELYAEKHRPDSLQIIHHSKKLGVWLNRGCEALYTAEGRPRWYEHPMKWVDVVALPLENYDTLQHELYFMDIGMMKSKTEPVIGMPLYIIGFVEGFAGPGVFPIWKAGHIASEPSLKYQGNNAFLIDATTRGGMSGSPVVYKKYDCNGNSGESVFLGIYAGRLSQDSEIGLVWTPDNIIEILESIP